MAPLPHRKAIKNNGRFTKLQIPEVREHIHFLNKEKEKQKTTPNNSNAKLVDLKFCFQPK